MDHDGGEILGKVTLPSGKVIEVRYFNTDKPTSPEASEAEKVAVSDLKEPWICRKCGSDLVQPVTWDEHGNWHWLILLRCPNCEHTEEGVFHSKIVDVFDARLDEATATMIRRAGKLMVEIEEDRIDAFAAALNANAILPEDFKPKGS